MQRQAFVRCAAHQLARAEHRQRRSFEVALQHRVAGRLTIEVRAGEEAQGAGDGVLASGQAVKARGGGRPKRRTRKLRRAHTVLRVEELAQAMDAKAHRGVHARGGTVAVGAEVGLRAAGGEATRVRVPRGIGGQAGRQHLVAEQDVDLGFAQSQRRRQHALERSRGQVRADVGADQHLALARARR